MNPPALPHRLAAEALGTFWLVFGGCGSAIFAAHFLSTDPTPVNLGIGFVGVALAFGLTVLTGVYALGHVSGGHFNPAVTVGVAVAKRFPWKDVPAYIVTQVVAGLLAGSVLYVIASGKPGFSAAKGFAANGFGATGSPGGYSLTAAFVVELVCSAFFLIVILGATDKRAPVGFAPIAIGLALTLIHLIAIPVTNTSVNPARTTAVAFFAGGDFIGQQWLFWVAPILGAAIAGSAYAYLTGVHREGRDIEGVVSA